jgi:2-methylcitrate dehydratase PrpD
MDGKSTIDIESAELFAALISETAFDDLPAPAVDAAKKSILDTIAVMAGAAGTTPALEKVVRFSEAIGGRDEASIIGRHGKITAMMAAFANGCMAHYLDYDDIEFNSVYHPSGAVVPAALAIAERHGWVDGAAFLTAVALGQDLGIRMARAIPLQRRPPWHRSVVIGTFAAAATAARLIGLDREGIVDALGHALNQAAGSLELRWGTEAEIGGFSFGYSAKAGVFSALMAEAGIPGVKQAFDGQAGIFNLYFEGRCNRKKFLGGLGKEFRGADCALRPWPACAATNTYILATLNAMKVHGLRAEDLQRVELHVGDYALKNCEPLEDRQFPATAPDAKFSLPYCVAAAAVHGDLKTSNFTSDALADRQVLALSGKTVPVVDPAFDIVDRIPPGAVTLYTVSGDRIHQREDIPYGHPTNPISWEQLETKAMDCFSLGRPAIGAGRGAQIVAMCRNLEQEHDLTHLYDLFSLR